MKHTGNPVRRPRLRVLFDAVGILAIFVLLAAGLCAGMRERRRTKIPLATGRRDAARAA